MVNMLYELDKTLRLPDRLRGELQKVYGTLVSEEELDSLLDGGMVISVGDVVTHTLLTRGVFPDIAVVDYRTKRSEAHFPEIKEYGDLVISVKNPPGCITPELWHGVHRAIEKAKSGVKVRVDVEGEEDLAVLPAVIFSPEGAIVIYGMPNTGLVALTVNDEHRMNALRIIGEMEV